MFESLFNNYKDKVLRERFRENRKNLDIVLKILLFALIIFASMSLVFCIMTFFRVKYSDQMLLVSLIASLVVIALIIIRDKILEFKKDYVTKKAKNAKENMRKFVYFLIDNNISIDNTSSIDSLIELANEKKEMTRETKDVISGLSSTFKYFVIPVITLALKDFVENPNSSYGLNTRFIIAALLAIVFSIAIVLIGVNIKSLFETNKQKIGFLISDLMEVKCFRDEAIKMKDAHTSIELPSRK